MADKSIEQLNAAERVNASDLFVLQQSGAAKKLAGQTLENWLLQMAEGHGGIQSIKKVSTSGLVDTYRITLSDTSTVDFTVTNARSITGISKTGTSGLIDTYSITFNSGAPAEFTVTNGRSITGIEKIGTSGLKDTYQIAYNYGPSTMFTITNGAKGDKGDNVYTWVKYSHTEPTDGSHSMSDNPDDWRGEYNGTSATAPTDWKQYKWYKIKGEKGDTGDPSRLVNSSTTYAVSDSGTEIPSGGWGGSIPTAPQGKFLWTRVSQNYNTGSPVVSYSVSRMGLDGTGAVSTVNEQNPDSNGNVTLTASNIQTESNQSVQEELNGKQGKISISGLLKGGGDGTVSPAVHGTDYQLPVVSASVILPASGWSGNTQTAAVSGVTEDSNVIVSPASDSFSAYNEASVRATGQGNGSITFSCEDMPAGDLNVNVMIINK